MKDFTKPASNRPTCRSKFSLTTTVKDKDCLRFSVWTWGDQKSKDTNTSSSYRIFFFLHPERHPTHRAPVPIGGKAQSPDLCLVVLSKSYR